MISCSTCEFAVGKDNFQCRRYPPVFVVEKMRNSYGDQYEMTMWTHPYVTDTDWCGEWTERPNARATPQGGGTSGPQGD